MTDTEQQDLVERFGRKDDPVRVLLCSDVASEGLNLHYFCHRLVHFDLPWSLMVFQQRNGRVDRYGQKHQPHIVYLFTETEIERIKGDLRILEILETKDEQANMNLGDPASFLNVYDPDKEADKVADFMADGTSPEQVEATIDAARPRPSSRRIGDNEGDWLLKLFGDGAEGDAAQPPKPSTDFIPEGLSLFGTADSSSDYPFAKTALTAAQPVPTPIAHWPPTMPSQIITLTAPLDLQERFASCRARSATTTTTTPCAPTRAHGPGHRASPPGAGRRGHLAAAALPLAAAPHHGMAGRPRAHRLWPPPRPGHAEPAAAPRRAGLHPDEPDPQPQGPAAAGRVAGRQSCNGRRFELEPFPTSSPAPG